jgi:glutathione S-transferase
MAIQLTAFKFVPGFAQGYVKDLRVRWALEEAGLDYDQVLIDSDDQASETYRRWQPFGQVPAYRDGDVELFESGAIVLHIAANCEALAPRDPAGRARVAAWVIAALNSIEPSVANVVALDLFHAGEAWVQERRPSAMAALTGRLDALAGWLGDREFLEDRFTAGDLMMTTVLRDLIERGVLSKFPALDAYRRRCEARPAFGRALEAQLKVFRDHEAA